MPCPGPSRSKPLMYLPVAFCVCLCTIRSGEPSSGQDRGPLASTGEDGIQNRDMGPGDYSQPQVGMGKQAHRNANSWALVWCCAQGCALTRGAQDCQVGRLRNTSACVHSSKGKKCSRTAAAHATVTRAPLQQQLQGFLGCHAWHVIPSTYPHRLSCILRGPTAPARSAPRCTRRGRGATATPPRSSATPLLSTALTRPNAGATPPWRCSNSSNSRWDPAGCSRAPRSSRRTHLTTRCGRRPAGQRPAGWTSRRRLTRIG